MHPHTHLWIKSLPQTETGEPLCSFKGQQLAQPQTVVTRPKALATSWAHGLLRSPLTHRAQPRGEAPRFVLSIEIPSIYPNRDIPFSSGPREFPRRYKHNLERSRKQEDAVPRRPWPPPCPLGLAAARGSEVRKPLSQSRAPFLRSPGPSGTALPPAAPPGDS